MGTEKYVVAAYVATVLAFGLAAIDAALMRR